MADLRSDFVGIKSPNPFWLASAPPTDKAYNVEVWETQAKKPLSSITGLSGVVNVANISPDGSKVVTAERTAIVGLWVAATSRIPLISLRFIRSP